MMKNISRENVDFRRDLFSHKVFNQCPRVLRGHSGIPQALLPPHFTLRGWQSVNMKKHISHENEHLPEERWLQEIAACNKEV